MQIVQVSDDYIELLRFNKDGFHETTSKTTKKHPETIRKEIITLLKSNPYLSRVDLSLTIKIFVYCNKPQSGGKII